MSLTNTEQRWGLLAQLLHWGMFLLILGAWFAVETREEFPKGTAERSQWMSLHMALGLSIFFLVWVRLAARFSQVTPTGTGPALQQKLATLVHLGLYLLMILMPVTGLVAAQLTGKPVSWFGVIDIPMFFSENKELGESFEELHGAGWNAMMVLVGLHAAAALYHQFVSKDGTLRRMLP